MTDKEFEYWKSVTNSSKYQWNEDRITRANGNGALFYIGGQEGYFMRISPDGRLTLGTYEGAYPHIGEAGFTTKAEHKYEDVNEAFTVACKIGGKQFLADMFKNDGTMFSLNEQETTHEIYEDIGDSEMQML